MAYPSPILPRITAANASVMPYGPPEGPIPGGIELVEVFESLELEYAALRKSAALLDTPHRGLVRVTGTDAADFLNNMLTRNVADLAPGQAARSFWLNRKGRIDADLRVIRLDDHFLLDLDAFSIATLLQTLGGYIITEDVELTDITQHTHRFELHGPRAHEALAKLTNTDTALRPPDTATIAGHAVTIDRHDTAGVPGFALLFDVDAADDIWSAFEQFAPRAVGGEDAGFDNRTPNPSVRPAGFHAWNIARIEAGTPVFNLDFGPDSLPAETGVLHDRVNFDKGCYLGQEVVARMHALGHPKRVLVAMQFDTIPADPNHPEIGPLQPVTGSVIRAITDADDQTPEDAATVGGAVGGAVGGITSSTLSPLLGQTPIAFATVKWGHHEPGTHLAAEASGLQLKGVIRDTLKFVSDEPYSDEPRP